MVAPKPPPPCDPYIVAVPVNTWTLVAVGVDDVSIKAADTRPKSYLLTQVDTGNPAPANDNTAIQMPRTGLIAAECTATKDFYVKAIGAAGVVIVWPCSLLKTG